MTAGKQTAEKQTVGKQTAEKQTVGKQTAEKQTAGGSLRQRLGVLAAAAAAALVIWAIARMLGVELTVGKAPDTSQVGAVGMLVTAVLAGLAAWGVQALLARRGAGRWWPFVGSTALAVSVIGPTWLADGAAGVVLICAHLAVGFVLIAGMGGVVPRAALGRRGPAVRTERHSGQHG